MRNSRRTYLENSFTEKEKEVVTYDYKNSFNIMQVNDRIEK